MYLDSVKPALIPSNLLAVWSCLRFTVRSAFDLTFEYVCHPCISDWFWLMVPQLLLVTACNLWDNKLDILGYQLTLLPGHWLTVISPSPNLVSLCLSLDSLINHVTWFPYLSVSQLVTQFCFVTFLHSGSSFLCGIVFLACVHAFSMNFLGDSFVSLNCWGSTSCLHSLYGTTCRIKSLYCLF